MLNLDGDEEGQEPVEREDIGEVFISKPYDPDTIRIDHQSVNLGAMIEMLKYNEIDLNPDFQRGADLWSDVQKSQLIESVLLGLPLPSFYFSVDKKTNKWLVVDGLQRLSTLKAFCIDQTLRLIGLEFLDGYENKVYKELSRADYRKISGFKINQYVIDKETPPEVKFLIFKRVNTGGLILTPQEMRHALNQGRPANFIKKLAELPEFRIATDHKISSKRQEDRSFVNRFLAFFLLGFEDNYEGELDRFLNDAMGKLDDLSEAQLKQIEDIFRDTMKLSFQVFGNDAFRKRQNFENHRNPISRAVFDTISVNFARLSNEDRQTILRHKISFVDGLISLFNSEPFSSSVSTSTGQKLKVKIRFDAIRNLIQTTLRHD